MKRKHRKGHVTRIRGRVLREAAATFDHTYRHFS